jgi:molecular chaperone DnaK
VTGLFSPIIPRNCKVPVSRTETYFTTSDNQKAVEIRIYQGEDRFVRNNVFLDAYTVDGLPPRPASGESVDVTFTYDINGILNVKTRVNSTNKEAVLVVDKSAQRMSPLERDQAKERLERDWKPGGAAVSAPKAPEPASEIDRLLKLAEAKAPTLAEPQRAALLARVEALKAARAAKDAAATSQAEAALTDLLFDLEP